VKKAEAKARQTRTFGQGGYRPPASMPTGPAAKPQNIDDVVNQLKSGALFRQRRQATDTATTDKGKEKVRHHHDLLAVY
jgi:hypothetical protein